MLKLMGRADASGLAGRWPTMYGGSACLRTQTATAAAGEEDPARSLACLLRDGQAAPPGTASTSWPDTRPG